MSTAKPTWQIEGEYFESCNCEVLCPCLLTGARPTEGHCDVVLAFHIDKGKYGSVDLAGLNAAQALTTPDVMSKGNGTLAVYEKGALRGTFGGYATGDKLQVAVENGVVTYRKNGAVFYVSRLAPTYPLLVDTALYTAGATLSQAMVGGSWH